MKIIFSIFFVGIFGAKLKWKSERETEGKLFFMGTKYGVDLFWTKIHKKKDKIEQK